MKINKYVIVDDKKIQIIDCNIVLELNACGRGFITIPAKETLFTNKAIILNLGYGNELKRFFTGFVESEQIADKNTKKLFLRELIGIYQHKIECSFQHPTLKTITEYLKLKTGLSFELPKASYVDIKIPHFKHSGTGYQLLHEIGRAFNIPDYTFYQTPTGKIYCGSYSDCFFYDKNIELGDKLNLISSTTAGSNIIEIPIIPSIRPGTKINNKKVAIVNLINDNMMLTFENQPSKKSAFRRQIEREFPELAGGYHLSKKGRVVAISDESELGDISNPFRPKYAVDVQLLDEFGNESQAPIYKAVPLPVTNICSEGGAYHYPEIGAEVELGFINGKPDQPVIRNIYPNNKTMPRIKKNEHLLQQRAEVFNKIDNIGNITRETDQTITDNTQNYCLNSDSSIEKTTSKTTIVNANYNVDVYSNYRLSSNTVSHIALKDYTVGTNSNYLQFVGMNYTLKINGNQKINVENNFDLGITNNMSVTANYIKENVAIIRQSIAGAQQIILAPSIWLGSAEINISQLMLDTLKLIERLADLTAKHTHTNTPPPSNASAIYEVKDDAIKLDKKYSPVIAK